MSKYAKFITAFAGGVVLVLTSLYGANTPWVTTIIAVLTALGVFQVPNAA